MKLPNHIVERVKVLALGIRYGEITIKINEDAKNVTVSVKTDERLPLDNSRE